LAEDTRLKKFIADQEEAVQLARSTPDGSNPVRIDAINVCLSLAHCNAEDGIFVSIDALLKDAAKVEAYLKAQD
jgi:hypothetical protein